MGQDSNVDGKNLRSIFNFTNTLQGVDWQIRIYRPVGEIINLSSGLSISRRGNGWLWIWNQINPFITSVGVALTFQKKCKMLRNITKDFGYREELILFQLNTLRTGDADLRFYITTVQDGWSKSAFLTRACFPCKIHLIMQYIEPLSEWSFWRMFIETWPHSELNFRYRASPI